MENQNRTPSSLDTTPLLDHPEVLAEVLHVAHSFTLTDNITNDLRLLADTNANEDARSEARARCYSHPFLRNLVVLCQAVATALPRGVLVSATPTVVEAIATAAPRDVDKTATPAAAPAVTQKERVAVRTVTEAGKVGKYRNSKPCSCCKKDRKKVRQRSPKRRL